METFALAFALIIQLCIAVAAVVALCWLYSKLRLVQEELVETRSKLNHLGTLVGNDDTIMTDFYKEYPGDMYAFGPLAKK